MGAGSEGRKSTPLRRAELALHLDAETDDVAVGIQGAAPVAMRLQVDEGPCGNPGKELLGVTLGPLPPAGEGAVRAEAAAVPRGGVDGEPGPFRDLVHVLAEAGGVAGGVERADRSEERRVGKEGRYR